MRHSILRFKENLTPEILMISILPLIMVSCFNCRNDDAPAPPPPPEILLKDTESNMNIIQNSAGEGLYPADQIRFFDTSKNEVGVFDISENGTIIYYIPPYVNEKDARFSYFIELEPGVQYEFELAHFYRSSECFGYLIDRIEIEISDNLYTLDFSYPVEIYVLL